VRVAQVLTRRGFLLGASAFCGCTSFNIPRAPGHSWTVDQADVPASRTLRDVLAKADTTGMMVIQRGIAIFTYGDLVQPTYLASARKSLIAMLYGPAVARGQIDLNATLKDMGFDDDGGLLPRERKATIKDLLTARSGVYHPAANLGDASERAPARGSVEPGSYFLYNNWDFNALGAIYQRLTGRDVYQAFEEDIATPIGMQDWRRDLQAVRNDTGKSQYPAHHFVLSTRDMARIGQLMVCRGQWNEAQVIEPEWVGRISSLVTSAGEVKETSPFVDGLGYGYLWWIFDPHANWPRSYAGAFTASGAFGQFITVVPQLDLVIAHKTAAPSNKNVPPEVFFQTILPAAVAMAT